MTEKEADPMSETLQLSVVVPAVNAVSDLRTCLQALADCRDVALEVIVVNRTGPETSATVAREFPQVIVLDVPGATTIPDMRATGIRAATAPFVGVIEDHVLVPPDWASRMLEAQGEGIGAVGGAVDNAATETLIDWAAFLCEYSSTLPPLPEGPSDWLPGNNVVYPREVLDAIDPVLDEGRWEGRLHDAIRQKGLTLMMRPEIMVGHKMHYSFGLYMSQRYLYSRSFAAGRAAGMGAGKRAVLGVASLVLLPPLMFYRTLRRVLQKKYQRGWLLRSLPLLVPFSISWGAGEAAGYLFGPGDALSRVR